MICGHVPGADDEFIVAVRPWQACGGNPMHVTEESVPDALQNMFIRQKIIAEIGPVVPDVGHPASLPIVAWQQGDPT